MIHINRIKQPPKQKRHCDECSAVSEFYLDAMNWSEQGAELCMACLRGFINTAIDAIAGERRRPRVKPRTYHEFRDAVDLAIQAGYRRAHKHTDKPSEDAMTEHIEREVMGVLCEMVEFPEVGE